MGVFVDEGRRPASPLASGRAQVVSKHADCGLHAGVADEGDQVSGTDVAAWEQEYVANVVVANAPLMEPDNLSADLFAGEHYHHYWDWEDFYDGAPRAGSI